MELTGRLCNAALSGPQGVGNERSGYLKEMMTQETTAGLALVAQLMVALRAAAGKAQSSLPPRAASLTW